jgi:hypothetical protein
MVDDGDIMAVSGVITMERHCFEEGGVHERGLGEDALLLAFLVKVSTKLDLIECATEDNVAWRRRLRSVGEGVPVRRAEEAERSDLRCSIVVLCVHVCPCCWHFCWRELDKAVPERSSWESCRNLGSTTISCSCLRESLSSQ